MGIQESGIISMVVDHRETNAELLHALEQHPVFHALPAHLETGDFKIGQTLLIERKTWPDFALSIIQGRLFRQALRLSRAVRDRNVEVAMFIIEGPEWEMEKLNVSREALIGAITSLQIKFALPVFRTINPSETLKQIELAYRQWVRDQDLSERSFPPRHGKFSPKNRRRNQVFILQGLPGIGASRAQDLLNHFGSVARVFEASLTELRQVKGIGKETAGSIREILEP